jgi:hypothetical protein
MEVLLIHVGALAMFLAYMAIVYWRGVSHQAQRPGRRSIDVSRASGAPESMKNRCLGFLRLRGIGFRRA